MFNVSKLYRQQGGRDATRMRLVQKMVGYGTRMKMEAIVVLVQCWIGKHEE